MIELKEINNFHNFTGLSLQMQRTVVSPLGTYLLRYNQKLNVNLFNLTNYQQIPININNTFLRATFSLDQKYIYFTNTKGIYSYSILSSNISYVIQYKLDNNIADFEFDPTFSTIYYLNKQQLYSFDYSKGTPKLSKNIIDYKDCNPRRLKYDYNKNIIVTSSVDNNRCIICKWSITDDAFVYLDSQVFLGCLVNDLYIFGDILAITKKNFNTANFGNTIIANLTTLNTIVSTQQQNDSPSRPGFIVPYHNYYLHYLAGSNYIFIYKDNFKNTPSNVSYKFVQSIAYNPYKQQLYIVSKDKTAKNVIKTSIPIFNCSVLNLTQNCNCLQGYSFNKQKLICQQNNCILNTQKTCLCPKGQTFNNFNLKCEISCTNVKNALPIKPYGSPQRCICEPQFSWDAKYIYCFNSTAQTSLPQDPQSASGTPAGVIVVIIIMILLLIAAALLYYYKKCNNRRAQQQNQNQQIQAVVTDRQLSEEQNARRAPNLQSNQHLNQREQRLDQPHEGPKGIIHNTEPEDLQNFSIDEDEARQNYFSQIESNIQNPLT